MNKKEIHSPLVITKDWIIPSIAKEYKYKAFGEMKYESGTYYDNHKFTGKEEDGSGLYYFGARYYDKSIGRWISPDPASMPSDLNLNDPQTLNPYVYCTNNPLRFIDPNGMWRTMVVNNTAYVVRQSKFYATTEFVFTTFGLGVGLVSTAMRATGGDITVGAADWGSGVVGSIPGAGAGLGTVAKMLIGSAKAVGIARGATLISESNVDKINLAIYSKLTGNPADPLYNLGEGGTYRYKLGNLSELKEDETMKNLPNFEELQRIEEFWTLMGAAKWDWEEIGNKDRYQDIYDIYQEVKE